MVNPLFRKFPVKMPNRITRYFILSAIIVFTAYMMEWSKNLSFIMLGPPLFLAYFIQNIKNMPIDIGGLPSAVRDYCYILPITLAYYGAVGFILKQLLLERAKIGIASLIVFIAFLLYIHYNAWNILSGYYEPFPYP